MKKNVLLTVIVIIMSLGFQSCSDDKDSNTTKVQLKLIDAPGDYKEVNIEIIDIQYNSSDSEDSWRSFTPVDGYPINIDLTELIAGNSLLLTDEIIPSGMLKQIRLVLSNNNTIVIEGEINPIHLDTPSAQQSGLKLKLDAELEPGFSYTFILDWDVQKSIVKAGNSGKYLLKPVIRVNTEVNSGSISGKVIGEVQGDNIDDAVPLKDITVSIYTTGDTYIAESLTNENGDFIIQGLGAGNYKIKIENYDYINYESAEVITVTVGDIINVGTIELLVPVS
ncbi:MAG: DUF4382 domain-containing protein [Flavobacteriaceae bacterium]|nr:DUF4382 domain-containing protein [Flavobacteriaceae bacterium]